MFCNENILENDDSLGKPMTVPGRGVAHSYCAEKDLNKKRIFGSVHIADLEDDDLLELFELVQTEVKERIA